MVQHCTERCEKFAQHMFFNILNGFAEVHGSDVAKDVVEIRFELLQNFFIYRKKRLKKCFSFVLLDEFLDINGVIEHCWNLWINFHFELVRLFKHF